MVRICGEGIGWFIHHRGTEDTEVLSVTLRRVEARCRLPLPTAALLCALCASVVKTSVLVGSVPITNHSSPTSLIYTFRKEFTILSETTSHANSRPYPRAFQRITTTHTHLGPVEDRGERIGNRHALGWQSAEWKEGGDR